MSNGNGHRAGEGALDLLLDARGFLRPVTGLAGDDPTALAAELCTDLGELLATRVTPVAVQALHGGDGPVGVVMLREEHPTRVRFRAGTAAGVDPGDAILQAIVNALGLDTGVLAATADRWAEHAAVRAVTAIDGDDVTASLGADNETQRQRNLVRSLPAAGRLSVATEEAEHRVLRLPAGAVAISVQPDSGVLAEVDEWMARVEERCRA